ncbi:DUF3100 domain-containing protein [Micropruina sp.]|uniref:DUF3100 domain-containing protein n=1 Tax=Micropruina sp. TaxID=2737536 RepID=UPI0039E36F74
MLSLISELIGSLVIPLGIASVTLLPMIWGLLGGIFVSGQRWRPMPLPLQEGATAIMGVAVLFLGARLSFSIGPNVMTVVQAGPALLLQELGHLFGTLLLALPLAVLLKMGPATIGATFSIDREASFAMVNDRYGSDSPQYQGVLSMYVFGTIFGAIIVSLIASLTTSLGIFDARALAMGAGVGSGSMMAAAASVIITQHADMKDQVLALAATSNLITSVVGLYVGVWVALPLADKFYHFLTGNKHRQETKTAGSSAEAESAAAKLLHSTTTVPLPVSLLVIIGLGLLASMVHAKSFSIDMVFIYLVMAVIVWVAVALAKVTRGKLPAIVTVITLGALATTPFSPVAAGLIKMASSVELLSLITVLLTVAGLGLGKDLPMLRTIGWKIIPVGIVAIGASFVLATVVAEFALGLWH